MVEQNAAFAAAQSTLELANIRYVTGVDPYLNVIVAQVALLNAQEAAITFRAQQLMASVQSIRALGVDGPLPVASLLTVSVKALIGAAWAAAAPAGPGSRRRSLSAR